jgi:hypothetical protein
VIGNNDYLKLNKLQTAVNDATAVAQLLQGRYGFQATLLKNATRNDILTALSKFRKTLPDNANLLIYYAGHGYNDKQAGTAYWLPVNAESDNNENWISADDITTAVHVMPALHVLIISDSCYSGDLTRGAFDINLGSSAAFLQKMLKTKSRTLMASGGDEPVADGGTGGHSVFAGALIQNLNQIQDTQFTGNALFQRIQQQVGGLSKTSQVPHYETIRGSQRETGDDGDFVFSRGAAASAAGGPGAHDEIPRADYRNLISDVSAIEDVLRQYQLAYNELDTHLLWTIWPGAPKRIHDNIEKSFSDAASIRMSVELGAPEIVGAHAIVKGNVTQTYTPKVGDRKPLEAPSSPIEIVLDKKDGKWTISSVSSGK